MEVRLISISDVWILPVCINYMYVFHCVAMCDYYFSFCLLRIWMYMYMYMYMYIIYSSL